MAKETSGPKGPVNGEYRGQQVQMNLPAQTGPASLEALCENIIFRNEENGYTVAVFSPSGHSPAEVLKDAGNEALPAGRTSGYQAASNDQKAAFTAVGNMPFLEPGDFALLSGKWAVHSSYGRQFQVENYTQVIPHTPAAILQYLSSGSIHGIGPKLAAKIVGTFGEETIRIMREEPEKLARIRGITPAKARQISAQMLEKGDFQELSLLLTPFGIGMGRILNIYRRFGSAALYVVKNNPYRLADEVSGIGFHTADSLAAHFGCDPMSSYRIGSAIIFCLTQSENEGNTYLPLDDLLLRTTALLSSTTAVGQDEADSLPFDMDEPVHEDKVQSVSITSQSEGYQQLIETNRIIAYRIDTEGNFSLAGKDDAKSNIRIAIPKTLETEIASAKIIAGLVKRGQVEADAGDVEKKMLSSSDQMGIELAPEQRKAVLFAANSYVSIITGGPGTGKTTIIRVLTDYFHADGKKAVLCAPTGRAAKRMSEASGVPAKTIHRLLEMERSGDSNAAIVFKRNEENPIDADAVIVDETSMLDSFLFLSLLRAIGKRTQIVFVGDSDQLPSVGAGNVLSDMISSGAVHVERLTEIFRQAKLSRIVLNAHRVLNGEEILFDQSLDSDCMLVHMESAAQIAQAVTKLCSQVLPNVYGIDVMRDAAVLCPSRKGPSGVAAMNLMLQAAAGHTGEPHISAHGFSFRLQDKVMQTRNNYDLVFRNPDGTHGTGVFNGELGFVREIDLTNDCMTIEMDDGRLVLYERASFDDLDPAFAVTVHKSQGSEYPVVILAVAPGSPMLNNRNLLYTAITRAKKRLFIVTSKKTLERMIRNSSSSNRMTSLSEFLRIYAEEG